MQTTHTLHLGDARDLAKVASASVHLVVTSPPYPMIAMWDEAFGALDPRVGALLAAGEGMAAFEVMHAVLDSVWSECLRALVPGGLLCVNIGDATRSLGGEFCLYPNHVRISTALSRLGATPLPDILWRKPSNAPNKFMGSGMLPAGAYVTYEHEYVLVFRKGASAPSRPALRRRQASAYFWEERNVWFSDLWADLRGARQAMGAEASRQRSGAFPFELRGGSSTCSACRATPCSTPSWAPAPRWQRRSRPVGTAWAWSGRRSWRRWWRRASTRR